MTDATATLAESPVELKKSGTFKKVAWGFVGLLVGWTILAAFLGHNEPLKDAAGEVVFKPQDEFGLKTWVNLDLGWIDMSINKAVAYLMLSSLICILVGIFVVRGGLKIRPTGAQNVVELLYDFADKQIAKQTLSGTMLRKYYPFIGTMFLFVLVNNMIGFVPLPSGPHASLWGVPDLALYAATANINVTVGLALISFLVFNYEGIKEHGVFGYVKTFIPSGKMHPFMKAMIFGIEMLSIILRLVSLAVRLFANLLAGHLLIIMATGFSLLLASYVGAVAIPFGLFFYLFEWVLIAGLQAFIFAMLSGLYIGFATSHAH
ncbi:MAG TPA: F0F1 ATP synthase subunit A [Miltoncostaeales bacterium]|nr:F0F1 ATP synthase subunit A [Miltoncostaeales bacterium]